MENNILISVSHHITSKMYQRSECKLPHTKECNHVPQLEMEMERRLRIKGGVLSHPHVFSHPLEMKSYWHDWDFNMRLMVNPRKGGISKLV